jgi:hypothetical protein
MALSPRDRRALMILGGVAGVAVVAFILLKVLGGGGGEEAGLPSPAPSGSTPPPTVSPTPTSTPRPTLPPVALAGSRDPFSIPPSLQSGSPGPSGSVSPTGSFTSPPPTSPTPTPTSPGRGQSTTVGGHTVILLDIFNHGRTVQVEVDGTVHTVSVGQIFASNFRLVSTSGRCARFLFGDQGFTLCLPSVPK